VVVAKKDSTSHAPTAVLSVLKPKSLGTSTLAALLAQLEVNTDWTALAETPRDLAANMGGIKGGNNSSTVTQSWNRFGTGRALAGAPDSTCNRRRDGSDKN